MKGKQLLFFLFLCFGFLKTYAQQFERFSLQFTKKDGLPSNLIYAHCFDQRGILWLGTDAGLTRFDGSSMITYTTKDGLPSNDIFYLFCDYKNRIWLKSLSSEPCYMLQDSVHHRGNDALLKRMGAKIGLQFHVVDKEKRLWGNSNNDKICILDSNDEFQIIPVNDRVIGFIPYKEKMLVGLNARNMVVDRRTLQYRISERRKYRTLQSPVLLGDSLLGIDEHIRPFKIHVHDFMEGFYVLPSMQYYTNYLQNTFCYTTYQGFTEVTITDLKTVDHYLPNKFVSQITKDEAGNLWVGTHGNGLFKILSSSIKEFQESNFGSSNNFKSIYVDQEQLLAGNSNGEIYVFDKKKLRLKHKVKLQQNGNVTIHVVSIKKMDNVLFATASRNNYYSFDQGKTFDMTQCHGGKNSLNLDSSFYFVCGYYGLIQLPKKTFFKDSTIISYPKRFYCGVKYNNNVYLGGDDSLYLLQKQQGHFNIRKSSVPLNKWITDLVVFDSLLIASTGDNGLFFIRNNEVLKHRSAKDGLASDICRKIRKYKNYLVIATSKGISLYDLRNDTFWNLYESEGLPSSNIFDICVDDNMLYCATESGIGIVPIDEMFREKKFSFFASNFLVNGNSTTLTNNTLVAHKNDRIRFKVNYLNFSLPINHKIFYRIVGSKSEFVEQKDQQINVSVSKFGSYEVEFFASNADGRLSEIKKFKLDITPYWYQLFWVKAIFFLLLLVPVFFVLRWWANYLNKKNQQLNLLEIKRRTIEIAEWKSTINPHFMFNSLNTVQSLYSGEEFERGNAYLSRFASLLRKSIDQSGKLMITLNAEMEFLYHYMELEKLKRKNFEYEIKMAKELTDSDYFIPTLVIQPVVENSFKHGIQDKPNGEITIQFLKLDGHISVRISDNGIGMLDSHVAENSKGINLIQAKLQLFEKITKSKTKMIYENRYDELGNRIGFQTIFTFPLITQNKYDKGSNH